MRSTHRSTRRAPASAVRTAGLSWAFAALAALPASGQRPPATPDAGPDTTRIVSLRLLGGGTLEGRVLARGDTLTLRLLSGDTLRVARERIVGEETLEGSVVDGEYWPADPNRTSLFVGPTARTLPQGRGYMASYELFFPLAGVGVTDHFTLAGGVPLVGALLDQGLFYVAPKVRFPGTPAGLDLAVGGLAFVAPEDGTVGVVYGVATVGDRDRSLTVGAMHGWVDDDWGEFFGMLGGEARVARRVKLIGESYFSSEAGLIMAGPRFFTDRLSADLGVLIPVDDGFETLLPMVNFMFSW